MPVQQHDKIDECKIISETQKFDKGIRMLVSNENKSWYELLEYHFKILRLYSLPKTHRAGTPM